MKDVMPILLDTMQEESPTEEEVIEMLRERNTVGVVVETEESTIAGLCLYSIHPKRVEVRFLCIHPNKQGQGYGRFVMAYLLRKLNNKRKKIEMEVSEFNVEAQMFLKASGFLCIKQTRNTWDVGNHVCDTYLFSRGKACLKLNNRITQHLQANQ